MKLNLKWSLGNRKMLKSGVFAFALPRRKTCPMAGACAGREMIDGKIKTTGPGFCYCEKSRRMYKAVIPAREFNLDLSRRADFVVKAVEDIAKLGARKVRVHDEGDFYSQEYLDKWAEVARQFPRVLFYAYTTSLHLDFSRLPANFRIVQSASGLLPVNPLKFHARVFPTHEARESAGYADGAGIDLPSLKTCPTKIGLVLH